VQIIKAALLIAGAFVMTFWVLGKYGLNFSALLGSAVEASPKGEAVLAPGCSTRTSWTSSRSASRWCWGRRGCRTS
jgi:cation/acetate symporter